MDQFRTYNVETYDFPLTVEDDLQITGMLRAREVFAASFIPQDSEDLYDSLTYRRQDSHHNTNTTILADRNIVTRWLALVSGKAALSEERLAAAIMAFAQSANIRIEPNRALYEATVAAGSETTKNELRQFRVADNLDTKHWADLALGRIQNLSIPKPSCRLSLIAPKRLILAFGLNGGYVITSSS